MQLPLRRDDDLHTRRQEPPDQTLPRVEQGETIVVTSNGRPVLDLTPHSRRGGLDFEAGREYLRARGITNPVPFVAEDFDDPPPEDFLPRPSP